MDIIEIENVSKTFERVKIEEGLINSFKSLFKREKVKVTALSDVSFKIKEGKIIGLIGANGAGKSTLMKAMVGLIKPTSGRILVNGFNPHNKKKDFLKSIGVVLGQKNQLWWDLSPYETFLLHKEIYELSDTEFRKNVDELAENLGVSEILKSPVRNLSLGERMKCELIASILHSPKILFLDEPTIGLDFLAQKNIRNFLKNYCKERNTTVIITSHYFPDIYELCEELIILKNGEVVFNNNFKKIKEEIKSYKYISLSFENEINSQDLKKYGEVKESDKFSVTIKIQDKLVNETISSILKEFNVIDYNLTEMSSQDLIEDIYSMESTGVKITV
ncbi:MULTISPECIES: ABC transporter ATP-binding protein [Bacillus]|uniref:ABC transporter ATP-binding protein n=1 Tax=Bacillus TaxID=1386 RepID=UPI00036A4426|nr:MULTISPECIES: ATP-binding cassette domain-containing protein [Bacillus]AIK37876.1 ABC transporter family protein [Bacillus pseudomycoides]AJI19035.1 ABC transporter family protein [Bacillus pseudomycoides]MBJ8031578.1 ATP-binding cassette domain-containing protein [Bacillus cereus group sp. N21]MEB3054396.1 ATP-binding cassette domain-containing protein [Bacillus pseudomycoides]MED4654621.1 ATP-binding cassette domain-containing protein [Bacillus pseudomycoides]